METTNFHPVLSGQPPHPSRFPCPPHTEQRWAQASQRPELQEEAKRGRQKSRAGDRAGCAEGGAACHSITHSRLFQKDGPHSTAVGRQPDVPGSSPCSEGLPAEGRLGAVCLCVSLACFHSLGDLERSRLCVHSGRPCASVWPVCTSVSISAKCD